jgi:hypothetical protein
MSSEKKLSILYVIRSVAHFSYQESIIRRLCEHGHKVIVLFDEQWSKNFDNTVISNFLRNNKNLKIGWVQKRADKWRKWIFPSREIRSYCSYLRRNNQADFYLNRWFNYTPAWFRKIVKVLPKSHLIFKNILIKVILELNEKIIPPVGNIIDSILMFKPDVLVATPINMRYSEEIEYVKAAKKIGIPVVVPVLSWDNLTTKGLFHTKPDFVLAWNKMHYEEAYKIHKIPKKKIIITGAPFFDKWFDTKSTLQNCGSFYEKIGLNHNLPFIIYLGSSKNIIPNEVPLLLELSSALRNSPDKNLQQMRILVRPHPANSDVFKTINEDNVLVWPPKGKLPDTTEDINDFYCSLKYAVACVGINTTAMIDAVILDRPTISIYTDHCNAKQTEVIHFMYLLKSECLYNASDTDDFIKILIKLIQGEDLKKNSRFKFLSEYIRPYGANISAGEISAKIIETIGYEKAFKGINTILHNDLNNQSENKSTSNQLINLIKFAENEDAYQNYLKVREWVLARLEDKHDNKGISLYWNEEISGFDYMFDASPLIINKLREHCYHLTGLRSYDYRVHHAHMKPDFENKLRELQKMDGGRYFVPENRALGGFGHEVDGNLVNIDTLKFYECLIALNKAINLSNFSEINNGKKTVLEIGAGWGGFAYQFKTLFPDTCYIIIDISETILFSGTYLKTLFKNSKFLFYGEPGFKENINNYHDYDFIFFPHYSLNNIFNIKLELCVNIASFQEMTTKQVSDYIEKVYQLDCPCVYSLNRDRSKHNIELTAVSKVISKRYDISEIAIMDMAYCNLKVPRESSKYRAKSIHEYKHIIGKHKTN